MVLHGGLRHHRKNAPLPPERVRGSDSPPIDFGLDYAAEITKAQVTIVSDVKSKTIALAMMAPLLAAALPKFPSYPD
jgi:hypothetical protein